MVAGGVQVVANQGAFLDLDGLLQERKVDWRFDDFGHFDHRKVIVIDGRVAYVGGPGIEDHYTTGTHDLMLRLEGPIVAQLQAVFLLSWQFQGGPLPADAAGLDRFFPPVAGAAAAGGTPGRRRDADPREQPGRGPPPDPDRVPRRRQRRPAPALRDQPLPRRPPRAGGDRRRQPAAASRSGSSFRPNPHSLPASGSVRHWFQALHDAGVDLREHPEMAHAKVVLADDLVLAGTANLDALSLRQNWELQLRIEDPAVADRFARELFDRDVEIATPAVMPAGWKDRAVNALMSAISPLL